MSIKIKAMLIKDANQGFVSVLVLIVIIALSWTSTQSFLKAGAFERMVRYEAQRNKAGVLADSGLEWAMAALSKDPGWMGGTKVLPTGKVEVTVVKTDSNYTVNTRSEIGGAVQKRYGMLERSEDGGVTLQGYGELYN